MPFTLLYKSGKSWLFSFSGMWRFSVSPG
ncbi:KxYKxGKxW signal peptide domain-containing protein [Algoriphagus winogradskyi]